MDKKKISVEIFEYFYRKQYHKTLSSWVNNKAQNTTLDKFVDNFPKATVNFLFDFVAYQFNYYFFSRRILPQQIFGIAAIERWKSKKKEWEWQVGKLLQARKIRKSLIISNVSEEQNQADYFKTHDYIENKKLVLSGYDRLMYCVKESSLWNPHSKVCLGCEMTNICKKILKENNCTLYNIRTNAKAKSTG